MDDRACYECQGGSRESSASALHLHTRHGNPWASHVLCRWLAIREMRKQPEIPRSASQRFARSETEKNENDDRDAVGHCVRTVISLDTSIQLQQVGIISFLSNGSIYARIHVAISCNRAYRASKRCTLYISTNSGRALSRQKLFPESRIRKFLVTSSRGRTRWKNYLLSLFVIPRALLHWGFQPIKNRRCVNVKSVCASCRNLSSYRLAVKEFWGFDILLRLSFV